MSKLDLDELERRAEEDRVTVGCVMIDHDKAMQLFRIARAAQARTDWEDGEGLPYAGWHFRRELRAALAGE